MRIAFILLLLLTYSKVTQAMNTNSELQITAKSTPKDFDFEIGEWSVKHRKLKDVFSNNSEWIEFEGDSSTKKILGGFGNLEENILHFPETSFNAVALRSFDPETKKWSIWWLDGRSPSALDVPVVGEFKNGIGLFFADDVLNDIPTKIRFTWDSSKPDQPHWEQAFSMDNGSTWQTNWTMDFFPKNKLSNCEHTSS